MSYTQFNVNSPIIMRKFLPKHKQFFVGLIIGSAVVVGIAVFNSSGSEPFRSASYIVRDINGDTLVKTPKFTVLYRGVGGVNVASSMTIAGKNSGISSVWNGGYFTNWSGSDKGIDCIALYDENEGIANFFVAGQLLRIKDNASQLQVANAVFPLDSSPVIIVDKNHHARIANGSEVKATLTSIDPDALEYGSSAPPKF